MKRFIKIFTTTIFVTMLTTMLAACYTPNPLYGTWSDNDGNKIQFIDDGTFTATIKDSDNQLISYSGDWSTVDNVLIFKIKGKQRIKRGLRQTFLVNHSLNRKDCSLDILRRIQGQAADRQIGGI